MIDWREEVRSIEGGRMILFAVFAPATSHSMSLLNFAANLAIVELYLLI